MVGEEMTEKPKKELLKPEALLNMMEDLEEEKRNAVEAQEKLKAIFDNASDGILIADMKSKKFYDGNKKICQMLGYTIEEIKNMGVMNIHPKKDLPYVIEQFKKQGRGEITLAKNIPVQRKDSSVFYADVNSNPVELGGKTYLIGVFRDITEQKKTREELKKFKSGIESAYDGYVLTDMNGKIIYVNLAASKIYGYSVEEFLKVPLHKLNADSKKTEVIFAALHRDGLWAGEIIGVRKSKEKFPEILSVNVIKSEEGKPLGMMGVFRDITAQNKVQEQAQKAKIVEVIVDPFMITDSKGVITDLNEAFTEMSGYSKEDLLGKPFSACYSDEINKKIFADPRTKGVLEKGTPIKSWELPMLAKDKRVITVLMSLSVMKDSQGKIKSIFALYKDITEQKKNK